MTSVVQTCNAANNSGTSQSASFGSSVSIGNSIGLAASGRQPGQTIGTASPTYNGSSVTGSQKLIDQNCTGNLGSTYSSLWLLPNVQSSGTSIGITVTNNANAGNTGIAGYEIAGLGTNPVIDRTNSNTNTGSSDQNAGSTGALTYANEFVFSCVCQDGTTGPNYPVSGWTNISIAGNTLFGDRVVSASGGSFSYDLGTPGTSQDFTAVIGTIAPTQKKTNLLMASFP